MAKSEFILDIGKEIELKSGAETNFEQWITDTQHEVSTEEFMAARQLRVIDERCIKKPARLYNSIQPFL